MAGETDEIVVEEMYDEIEITVNAPTTEIAQITAYAMPGPQGPPGSGGGGGGDGGPEDQFDAGSILGGNFSPLSSNGKYQYVRSEGTWQLRPPTLASGDSFHMFLTLYVGEDGDVVIPTGWDLVRGDPLTHVHGDTFVAEMVVSPAFKILTITKIEAGIPGGGGDVPFNPSYVPLIFRHF